MPTTALPDAVVADPAVQRNLETLLVGVNAVGQYIYACTGGAPTSTPPGAAIAFRTDPAPGAAVYGFDGTSWTAIV